MSAAESAEPAWHQALAFALLGEKRRELGRQSNPDLAALLADLAGADGPDALRRRVELARAAADAWPFPVPAELMAGIGAAQFLAAVAELRSRLGVNGRAGRVTADRLPDRAEQELLREVPPHHNG